MRAAVGQHGPLHSTQGQCVRLKRCGGSAGVSWGVYFAGYNRAKARYQRQAGVQKLPPQMHLLAAAEGGALVCYVIITSSNSPDMLMLLLCFAQCCPYIM